MPADRYGNPLTADAAALPALDDFTHGFVAGEAKAANMLARADTDDAPVVQALCAALQLFGEDGAAAARARPHTQRAGAAAHTASPREQSLIACIAAWADGDTALALARHQLHQQAHPRDLLALKLGHYHAFNHGDAPAMLRLALLAQPACADVPQFHGMLAFAYEQCHLLPQAEAAAHRAVALERKEPWAHHAVAHVMLTQGRFAEGLAFCESVADTWVGLNSFMVTHNWWHVALFAIELGDAGAALRLYDERVWGVARDYTQDQVNAVSLLARLELVGVDVGARWQELGAYLAARTADQVLPFLDLQYLYGLARAGRHAEAATLRANLAAHAAQRPGEPAWSVVAVPAADGLLAHAAGDWARAADALGTALPRLLAIGGSHAQRDLFAQLHLDALVRAGQWVGAHNILQPLATQLPQSRRLAAQLGTVYAALGLPSPG